MTFKFLKIVLTTCRYAVMLSVGAVSIAGNASATLIDSIAALEDGDQYRVLFVTSTTRDATSSDISVYNSFVNDAAQSGVVTGIQGLTWTALASTSAVDAITNTGLLNTDEYAITIFNTNGDILALTGNDLWDGFLEVPVGYDEGGMIRSTEVWTGTSFTGEIEYGLGDGQGDFFEGFTTTGFSDRFWNEWVVYRNTKHDKSLSLYGVSNQVAHAAVQVPSPSTVILLSLGLAGLSYSRYRKQS
jgi:hypothetical protein